MRNRGGEVLIDNADNTLTTDGAADHHLDGPHPAAGATDHGEALFHGVTHGFLRFLRVSA